MRPVPRQAAGIGAGFSRSTGSRYTPPAARTSATVTGGETPIVPELTGEALTTGLTLPALTAAGLTPPPLQAVTSVAVPASATTARTGFIPPTTPAEATRLCLDDMPSGGHRPPQARIIPVLLDRSGPDQLRPRQQWAGFSESGPTYQRRAQD